MPTIGLDIGTTSVCAVVATARTLLFSRTVPNNSHIHTPRPFETAQDPAQILTICTRLIDECLQKVPGVAGIGITGQMHGILYLNADGQAVSPLYTWQDESGNQLTADGETTYARELSRKTNYTVASGFGCATLYAHSKTGLIPENAVRVCTIMDYVAMRLAGLRHPTMHTSNAASFGLFNLKRLQFDMEQIEKAGLPTAFFPAVITNFDPIGSLRGIPVIVAIGDNQASFLGAASDCSDAVLVNIGTGSQISWATEYVPPENMPADMELRPLVGERYLCVGSALCGGRAYAQLMRFFGDCAQFLFGETPDSDDIYTAMAQLISEPAPIGGNAMLFDTRLAGTRADPTLRGSIRNVGLDNFTPTHLTYAVMEGMARELYDFCAQANIELRHLIGAGNALRKNPALCDAVSRIFGCVLRITPFAEEAAVGAAATERVC
ncbi:MAG: hypothetical protein LBB67_04690 [Oscillospiraceae bacterium]|jgi:sedoheptulokinase|nr:hypothetical protein [Oscillospiraceae bacterium]